MSHKGVQNEELADDVNTIQDFDKHVQSRQIGAFTLVAQDQTDLGCLLLHSNHEVVVVLAVSLQPTVDIHSDVFDGLVAFLGFGGLGTSGHIDDLLQVKSGIAVQHSPDKTGDLEKESHEDENDGHPLVVSQLLLAAGLVVQRNGLLQRNIVRIFNPAVGLRIRYIRPRKLGGAPALDGVPYILSTPGKYGEYTEQDDGVDVVDAVHPVIVIVSSELVPARPTPENPHHSTTHNTL